MSAQTVLRTLVAAVGAGMPEKPSAPQRVSCKGCSRRVGRLAPLGLCGRCLAEHDAGQQAETLARVLPALHHEAAFGSPALTSYCRDVEAIRRAENFATAPPDGCRVLLLWGPTTAGKSTLAAAIMRRLLEGSRRGADAVWTDVRVLARARRGYPLGAGEPPVIARALEADVAVFDDLGKERDLPAEQSAEVVQTLELRFAGDTRIVPAGALDIITTELPPKLSKEEADDRQARGVPVRDLARCYDLSFARRIAGQIDAAGRGSAVVIPVRRIG